MYFIFMNLNHTVSTRSLGEVRGREGWQGRGSGEGWGRDPSRGEGIRGAEGRDPSRRSGDHLSPEARMDGTTERGGVGRGREGIR